MAKSAALRLTVLRLTALCAMTVLCPLTILCLSAPVAAHAAEYRGAIASEDRSPEASHAIYVELNTLFPVTASLGLNYAYRFSRRFAVSGGLGAGGFGACCVAAGGVGVQALAHWLLLGRTKHFMEAAVGASAVFGSPTLALPAAFWGYRYHPMDGGGLFRIGAGWSYVFGVGLSISGGMAF